MHTFRNTITTLIALCLILVLAASAAANVAARQDEPVTYYRVYASPQGGIRLYLDPHVDGGDPRLLTPLIDTDPYTGQPIPTLATSWQVSDDGRVWTFTLRDDVPWVHWDQAAGEATVARMVTAHDAVYAFQRTCDPRLDVWVVSIAGRHIQGCNLLYALDPVEVTDDDYALVQVRALDDTTLEITLQQPAGYLLNLLALMPLRPLPHDEIQTYGPDWTLPEQLVTNGPYVLEAHATETRWSFLLNPHFPADLRGPGNIERVEITVVPTFLEALTAYQAHMSDAYAGSDWDTADILRDPVFDDQWRHSYNPASMYIGFTYDKPPFDNMHIRRAFAASFNRDEDYLISAFEGVPLIHFTPPGVFGAPPLNEVGMGYDPEYAREQLALGGYPDCEGFPEITYLIFMDGRPFAEDQKANWVDDLGCEPGFLTIEETPFPEMSARIGRDAPLEFKPHLHFLGWSADYLDANNFLGDFLGCDGANNPNRPCGPVDDLIDQAARETDPVVRVALYAEIEARFFGPQGEHPLIPVMTTISSMLVKPWFSGPFETDSFGHLDWYTIDQEAQLAAQGG